MHEGLEGLSSQTLRHTHAGTHTYLLFSHDVFLSSSTQDYFQSFKVMILQKRSICLIKKEVQSDKKYFIFSGPSIGKRRKRFAKELFSTKDEQLFN